MSFILSTGVLFQTRNVQRRASRKATGKGLGPRGCTCSRVLQLQVLFVFNTVSSDAQHHFLTCYCLGLPGSHSSGAPMPHRLPSSCSKVARRESAQSFFSLGRVENLERIYGLESERWKGTAPGLGMPGVHQDWRRTCYGYPVGSNEIFRLGLPPLKSKSLCKGPVAWNRAFLEGERPKAVGNTGGCPYVALWTR